MNGRILSVLAAAALALAAPATVGAQQLYISGGATFPTGDFGDYANTGWQIAGGIVFSDVYTQGLSLGVDGFYGENSHDDFSTSPGDVTDTKTNPYGIMGIAMYDFSAGTVDPYIFGGAGWLAHKYSGTIFGETIDSETDSGFGYQLGAGIGFGLSESISIYGEGRYTAGTGDVKDTKFISALAGLAFAI